MQTHNAVSNRDTIGLKIGLVGLAGNLLLVLIKLIAGYLSNSIAVIADAFNNLTDCASSIITLLGFFLASKGSDSRHPYGHGRMEYICGFMISNLILITAFSVGKNSILRWIEPQTVHVSNMVVATLSIGIAVKLFMALYVTRLNRDISSPALNAVQKDNLSDSLVTLVTLVGILLIPGTSLPVDGVLGILVSLSILWSGITSFRENLVLLLGEGINEENEQHIRNIISEYDLFKSVEIITLHDYGPDERLAFIKVAFRKSPHSPEASETLERVKKRLQDELGLDTTIYWDTIDKSMLKESHSHEYQNHFH